MTSSPSHSLPWPEPVLSHLIPSLHCLPPDLSLSASFYLFHMFSLDSRGQTSHLLFSPMWSYAHDGADKRMIFLLWTSMASCFCLSCDILNTFLRLRAFGFIAHLLSLSLDGQLRKGRAWLLDNLDPHAWLTVVPRSRDRVNEGTWKDNSFFTSISSLLELLNEVIVPRPQKWSGHKESQSRVAVLPPLLGKSIQPIFLFIHSFFQHQLLMTCDKLKAWGEKIVYFLLVFSP